MGLVKLNDVFDVEETEEDKKYTTKVGVPQVINHYMNIKRHTVIGLYHITLRTV